jgi:hypothetical protein
VVESGAGAGSVIGLVSIGFRAWVRHLCLTHASKFICGMAYLKPEYGQRKMMLNRIDVQEGVVFNQAIESFDCVTGLLSDSGTS